VSKTDCAKYLL